MSIIQRVQGDIYPILHFVIKDKNAQTADINDPDTWPILDLTGLNVLLRIKKKASSDAVGEVTASFVTDGSDGEVSFKLTQIIVDAAIGSMVAEIVLVYAGSEEHTIYDILELYFREKL